MLVTDDDEVRVEGPEDIREHLLALTMGLASTTRLTGTPIDDVCRLLKDAYNDMPEQG